VRAFIGYRQEIFISQDNHHKRFYAGGMQTRLEAPLVWYIAETENSPCSNCAPLGNASVVQRRAELVHKWSSTWSGSPQLQCHASRYSQQTSPPAPSGCLWSPSLCKKSGQGRGERRVQSHLAVPKFPARTELCISEAVVCLGRPALIRH